MRVVVGNDKESRSIQAKERKYVWLSAPCRGDLVLMEPVWSRGNPPA